MKLSTDQPGNGKIRTCYIQAEAFRLPPIQTPSLAKVTVDQLEAQHVAADQDCHELNKYLPSIHFSLSAKVDPGPRLTLSELSIGLAKILI